jgi:hypothetical protein
VTARACDPSNAVREMNGWMDGWMDGWMEMNGWMEMKSARHETNEKLAKSRGEMKTKATRNQMKL